MSVFTEKEREELRRSTRDNFIIDKTMFMAFGAAIAAFFAQNHTIGIIAAIVMFIDVIWLHFRSKADTKMLDRIFAEKEAIREL